MASNSYFQKQPTETVSLAVGDAEQISKHKLIEGLTVACQKLDNYLNSSPSDPPCFLTRQVIADAGENSPLFSMARSLPADPGLIKKSVTKVANPILQCLRSFIDVHG